MGKLVFSVLGYQSACDFNKARSGIRPCGSALQMNELPSRVQWVNAILEDLRKAVIVRNAHMRIRAPSRWGAFQEKSTSRSPWFHTSGVC